MCMAEAMPALRFTLTAVPSSREILMLKIPFKNAFSDLFGVLSDHAWQDKKEEIIFITGNAVIRTAFLADGLRDNVQHIIANLLAVALIDGFEIINIQRDRLGKTVSVGRAPVPRGYCQEGFLVQSVR